MAIHINFDVFVCFHDEVYRVQSVCIAIPAYSETLNLFELVALKQVRRVLGAFPIYFVMPEYLRERVPDYAAAEQCIFFPDEYFQSTVSYSHMMLSDFFYEAFQDYTYILLYQLDAFVFADRLAEFCTLGYDYIGAPCRYSLWDKYGVTVGNGGFSLRHVAHTRQLLQQAQALLQGENRQDFFMAEDIFYAYCGQIEEYAFHVPPVSIAKTFAMQANIPKQDCVWSEGHALPFGCHAWPKLDYHKWRAPIRSFGYDLPAPEQVAYLDSAEDNFLHDFFAQVGSKQQTFQQHPLRDKKISIWGIGEFGKQLVDILQVQGFQLHRLYDSRLREAYHGMAVNAPSRPFILQPDEVLVIGTVHDFYICRALQEAGLHDGERYFRLVEFLQC